MARKAAASPRHVASPRAALPRHRVLRTHTVAGTYVPRLILGLDYTRLRRARLRRGLARPRLRRVARGKPRARKAAARGFAARRATHGRGHVRTTINIEITRGLGR